MTAGPEGTLIDDGREDRRPTDPTLPAGFDHLGSLGQGGMGAVHLVEERATGRRFALKAIRGRASAEAVRRFAAEARAMARLGHPDILEIHDGGLLPSGEPYYLMPVVPGRSLDVALPDLALEAAVRILARVARAVGFAHDRGIVHRDLKPANVMVGDHGEVWVVDWGLARLGSGLDDGPSPPGGAGADGGLEEVVGDAPTFLMPGSVPLETIGSGTRAGSIMGSPGYMPPEQARGEVERMGPASDVHALGAILYEALTGVPPYGGGASVAISRTESGAFVPPAERAPDRNVPAALASVAGKALAKDPADRYPDGSAFARELERYLAGLPVAAHAYGRAERARLWLERHPALATAIGLAAIGLVASGLLLGWQASLASERRAAANRRTRETRAWLATSEAEAAGTELAAARKAFAELQDRARRSAAAAVEVHVRAEDVPAAPSSPDPEGLLEAPLREWRTRSRAAQSHLEALAVRAGDLAREGLELSPDASATLERRGVIEAELALGEVEWSVFAALWVEQATISSERLAGLAATAELDPRSPGLAEEYRVPIERFLEFDRRHPRDSIPEDLVRRRDQLARALSAVGTLDAGEPPPGTTATLWRYDTAAESPVFPLERVDLAAPIAGRLSLPIGSYVVVLERGADRFRFPVLVMRPLPVAWFGEVAPARVDLARIPAGPVPPGLVWCPGGRFRFGGEAPNGLVQGWGEVRPFWIARTEATWEEVLPWIREVSPQTDVSGLARPELARVPAYRLGWDAAVRFAEWRSREGTIRYRLPTEFEWEYAARGADGRRYPWGDRFRARLAALEDEAPAGSHEADESPLGVRDLAGSRREWTTTRWHREMLMVRGGSIGSSESQVRAAARLAEPPGHSGIGIRLAGDP